MLIRKGRMVIRDVWYKGRKGRMDIRDVCL